MQIRAIRAPLVEEGQDLAAIFCEAVGENLQEKDVVTVVSKVISVAQKRVVSLSAVDPSPRAQAMSQHQPGAGSAAAVALAELVLNEADQVFAHPGGLVYPTLKNLAFVANAGIDLSNVPDGYAVLWPEEPWAWVRAFRDRLRARYQLEHLGVLITDSHVTPLRRGVTGLALAYTGFVGVESQIGKPDLHGHPLRFTEKAVADDLAAASVLLTGEAGESTPFALIRDAPVAFTHCPADSLSLSVDPDIDLYAAIFTQEFKDLLGAYISSHAEERRTQDDAETRDGRTSG